MYPRVPHWLSNAQRLVTSCIIIQKVQEYILLIPPSFFLKHIYSLALLEHAIQLTTTKPCTI